MGFSLFIGINGFGQGVHVYGRLKDTILNRNCGNATLSVLKKDSTLLGIARSDVGGYFAFAGGIPAGNYIIQVRQSEHDIYSKPLLVPDCAQYDLGLLFLSPRSDTLTAVTISGQSLRPKLKGDTLEYSTENIRLQPNAAVEELLRRLPGLEIAPDGTITYNGEKIQHLLVDGEDIFGSSPTLVTRNFDGSQVARVQILERRSNQAQFTGVDDGVRTKTLNLVLKESARNSYFGKVEAGGGDNGDYNLNAIGSLFTGKQQITILGLASNVGVMGVSNSSGGSSAGISVGNPEADALGASAGTGIPQLTAGGLHYANTWNGLVDHLSGNYQYGHLFTQPVTTTHTVQTLSDSVYIQDQVSRSTNIQNQHLGNMAFDYKLNASSSLRFSFNGSSTAGRNQFAASESSSFNGVPVNGTERTIQSQVDNHGLNGEIGWRISAAAKPARVFSIVAGMSKSDNVNTGYLYSNNRFFQPNGILQSSDTTDERKQISDHSASYTFNLAYTQPVWKDAILAANYRVIFTADKPLVATYSLGNGKYNVYIDSLSSQFEDRTLRTQSTLNLQGKIKQLTYVVGSDWITYGFQQKDILHDSTGRYRYDNLASHVMLTFMFDPHLGLQLGYSSLTQAPSLSQLEPVINNNDPLHISIGNPELKPGFIQNIGFNIRRISTWMLNLGFNIAILDNSISSKTSTDSLGRQITQPVNVDGGRFVQGNFAANRKILGVDFGFRASTSFTRTMNYVNSDLTGNNTYSNGAGISLGKYVIDEYSIRVSTNFAYLDQTSSINPATPLRYWTQQHSGSLSFFFVRQYEINSTFSYTWQEKTSTFPGNTSVLLWNNYISRNFLHDKLVLKAAINNLLNANAGISRMNTGNITTESSSNILGRYWMFSAIYHFDRQVNKKKIILGD